MVFSPQCCPIVSIGMADDLKKSLPPQGLCFTVVPQRHWNQLMISKIFVDTILHNTLLICLFVLFPFFFYKYFLTFGLAIMKHVGPSILQLSCFFQDKDVPKSWKQESRCLMVTPQAFLETALTAGCLSHYALSPGFRFVLRSLPSYR